MIARKLEEQNLREWVRYVLFESFDGLEGVGVEMQNALRENGLVLLRAERYVFPDTELSLGVGKSWREYDVYRGCRKRASTGTIVLLITHLDPRPASTIPLGHTDAQPRRSQLVHGN